MKMKIVFSSTNKIDRAIASKCKDVESKFKRTGRIIKLNAVQTLHDLKDDRVEIIQG